MQMMCSPVEGEGTPSQEECSRVPSAAVQKRLDSQSSTARYIIDQATGESADFKNSANQAILKMEQDLSKEDSNQATCGSALTNKQADQAVINNERNNWNETLAKIKEEMSDTNIDMEVEKLQTCEGNRTAKKPGNSYCLGVSQVTTFLSSEILPKDVLLEIAGRTPATTCMLAVTCKGLNKVFVAAAKEFIAKRQMSIQVRDRVKLEVFHCLANMWAPLPQTHIREGDRGKIVLIQGSSTILVDAFPNGKYASISMKSMPWQYMSSIAIWVLPDSDLKGTVSLYHSHVDHNGLARIKLGPVSYRRGVLPAIQALMLGVGVQQAFNP
jgi:hypothetical protein